MGCFVTPAGSYYQGDRAHALDIEVPQRPSSYHTWNGAAWIAPDPVALRDALAATEVDARDRLAFEINFDQESRIRVLEGRPAITRAQYRNALIAAWKSFN